MITKAKAQAAAATLALSTEATLEEIQTAYRVLAAAAHPDKGGSVEAFVALRNARDYLAAWRELQGEALPAKGCPHCVDGRVAVRTGFRSFTRICPHCLGAG